MNTGQLLAGDRQRVGLIAPRGDKDGVEAVLQEPLQFRGGGDALAALEGASAVPALMDALEDEDREIRLAGGFGLAKIGSVEALDNLLKAADTEPGWERIQATKHCLVLAEKLKEAGNQDAARKIYTHLRRTRTDPSESYVKFVAAMALTK